MQSLDTACKKIQVHAKPPAVWDAAVGNCTSLKLPKEARIGQGPKTLCSALRDKLGHEQFRQDKKKNALQRGRSNTGREELWDSMAGAIQRLPEQPDLTGPASSRGLGYRPPEVPCYQKYSSVAVNMIRMLICIMEYTACRHNSL